MMRVRKVREVVADVWGVPKDVIMDLPKISVSGNCEIYIENYKGLLEYTSGEIRLATACGIIRIGGKDLSIDMIRINDIIVSGSFSCIEYEL